MALRRSLAWGVVILLVLATVGNSPVMAARLLLAREEINQEGGQMAYYMMDVEMVDDDNGWGVGAEADVSGSRYYGVKFYRFADNQFTVVGQLYTEDTSVPWWPIDLEMVGDRGWFALVDFSNLSASRLIKAEAGVLTEVNVRVPQGTLITAIDLIDADNGWAVGGVYGDYENNIGRSAFSPVILRLEDGVWTSVETPAGDYFLTDVEMLSPNEGWAVGVSGKINIGSTPENVTGVFLHYRDGEWALEEQFPQMAALDIEFYDDGTGWAIGGHESDMLIMFHYQDGSWQPSPVGFPADYEFHISFADIFANFELTGPNSGFVSTLYPEVYMPNRALINLLQLVDGNLMTGVVFSDNQSSSLGAISDTYIGNFVAVSPSRNRVIGGMLDSCLSGPCLVTYELADDGTWHELSVYP